MPSKAQYKAKQKKDALNMLAELSKRIKNDTFEVENSGFWQIWEGRKVFFKVNVINVKDFPENKEKS